MLRAVLFICGSMWLLIATAWATKGDWTHVLDASTKAWLSFGWAFAISAGSK